MTTIRPFSIFDLLKFNRINLDLLTETFNVSFYGKYISKWPEYCVTLLSSTGALQAYLLGKVEGDRNNNVKRNWHGHVTAITVAPYARRLGLATFLMDYLEKVTIQQHDGWYVDLFVRPSNKVAVGMYRSFGYDVYQTVNKYYSSASGKSEDAYDMRKSMPRDVSKALMKATGKKIEPNELEFH
eukprot:TRINITY_DN10167_c0_g1_i1.p1 TRINITY_DN10167_c0_g1~~TRINITY_DN10167_c0_g1_i1.p1  ORF type:complete len:184 (+),score=10.28 TRINITY_DN10167_c0_g1_i1:122-673(+)